ncbi:MAG: fibronectin type III domain-containing protein [Anaerolineaceae bacterium]
MNSGGTPRVGQTTSGNYSGTDNDASDGWTWTIPADFPEPPEGAALFLRSGDFAENYRGVTISVNPLDSAPSSHLLSLSENTATNAIQLTWEVDANADSIQKFLVQYREGENEWANLDSVMDASDRQAWFIGANGLTYQFRLSAVDLTGREETWPDEAEAATTIEAACSPDTFEPVNLAEGQLEEATAVELNQAAGEHNFCGAGDLDWFQFSAEKGKTYSIEAVPATGGGAASVVQILSSDRQTVLNEAAALDMASSTTMEWEAPENGDYLIRLSALNPGVAGTSASYTLQVDQSGAFSIPGMVCGATLIPALLFLVKIVASFFKKRES